MKDNTFLIQHKDMQKTHTVKNTELEELRRNAIDEDLMPKYIIDTPDRRWVMVDEETWDAIWREAEWDGPY